MSRYFDTDEGQSCKWEACIFCKRKWLASSLELELCQECLCALRADPANYDLVKLTQFLKYGNFDDEDLAQAVKMLLDEFKKL